MQSHGKRAQATPTPVNWAEPVTIVLAAQPAQPQVAPAAPTAAELADTVSDTASDTETRVEAAGFLLDDSDGSAVLTDLARDSSARVILMLAAIESPSRAVALLEVLPPDVAGEDELVALIEHASEGHTKPAAAALVRMLDSAAPKVIEAASRALARSTGLSDKTPPATWRAWWQTHSEVPSDGWAQTLLSELIERTQTLERRQQRLDRLVLDTYRRLYIVTAPEARSALLAELLESDQPGVRDLGFELADRELSANATLDGAVATKATTLLSDASPTTRASAARLVNRLAPPDAAGPVTQALQRETTPIAAEALLAAAARWPSPDAIEPVLQWMRTPATLNAACQAGVALVEHGLLVGDEHRERVRQALLPLAAEPAPACLLLLNLVGTESDRHAIAQLLSSDKPRVRQAAADALARNNDSAALLVQHAVTDPSAAPLALVTLATHDRLALLEGLDLPQQAWDDAFAQATSPRVKGQLARHMLVVSAELSDDRRAELQAAVDAAGG